MLTSRERGQSPLFFRYRPDEWARFETLRSDVAPTIGALQVSWIVSLLIMLGVMMVGLTALVIYLFALSDPIPDDAVDIMVIVVGLMVLLLGGVLVPWSMRIAVFRVPDVEGSQYDCTSLDKALYRKINLQCLRLGLVCAAILGAVFVLNYLFPDTMRVLFDTLGLARAHHHTY